MAVNVILELGSYSGYITASPSMPYTITDNSNVTFSLTTSQGTFNSPSIYWFDDSEIGGSCAVTSMSRSSDNKTFTFTFRVIGNKTGTVYINPEMSMPLDISVVKNLTNCTTPQTFDSISSAGQYTIQTFPATGYFFIDADTTDNYHTISDSTVGTLGNVNFNKSGSTVSSVEFLYTAPTSGVATWTIYSKAYPSDGKRIDCYNDGTFTTNLISGAKYLNETVHVVLQAVSGKYFGITPTYDYNGISGTHNFTKVSDYEFYADISFPETVNDNAYTCVNIYAAALTDSKTYFTYNLTHCTISPEIEYTRYSRIFILSPDSGYTFNNAPTVTGATTVTIATMTTGDYRVSYTFNANETVTITAVAEETVTPPQTLNLTYTSLVNTDTNVAAREIESGEVLSITLTAQNTGASTSNQYGKLKQYYFTSAPYYTMAGSQINFTKVNDYTYTASITVTDNVAVTATATAKATLIKYTLQNCTGTPTLWKESDSTVTITVTADSGYVFETTNPPYWSYVTADRNYIETSGSNFTITLPTDSEYDDSYHEDTKVTATAVIYVPPPIDPTVNHGFINVYRPTESQLAQLSRYRFNMLSSSDEYADMGEYIYKLHKVFFHVPSTRTSAMQIAVYQTQIVVPAVDYEIITAECGSVTVSEQYHNAFDYDGFTNAKIYLPFIGFRDIDINNIMNDTVTLSYKLNVLNAECLAILTTANRDTIETFEGVAGFDIPYMLNFYNNGINHNFANNGVYMAGFTPYLQLFTKKPYNADNSPYGYKTNEWRLISTVSGYAEFEEVKLNLIHTNITQSELNKIKTLLTQGVFL